MQDKAVQDKAVQDKQADLSAQEHRTRHGTRPWTSVMALILAVFAAIISHRASHGLPTFYQTNHLTNQLVAAGGAVLFAIFGSVATYGLARKARQLLEPKAGAAYAAIVRYAILIVGAFTTLVITLVLFGVPVSQLVLGGALTTVFLSIAAQQALGNVFAGLVLVFARPFRVGDAIRLRAGALGGTLDGIVTDIGITYVRFVADGSTMSIPNSQVLNAVIGPIPRDAGSPADAEAKAGPPGRSELQRPGTPGPSSTTPS